jgi:hypothetical protein
MPPTPKMKINVQQMSWLDAAPARLRMRVTGWLKVPAIKAAVHRKDEKADGRRPTPQRRRRVPACA